jgi:hypothetical protein
MKMGKRSEGEILLNAWGSNYLNVLPIQAIANIGAGVKIPFKFND